MVSAQAKYDEKLKLIRVQIELDGSDFFDKAPQELKRLLGHVAYRRIQEVAYEEKKNEQKRERSAQTTS